MFYDFALTPDVFEYHVLKTGSDLGIVVVQILRGIADNGTIADLDQGRWLTYVMHNLANGRVPPELRDRVNACLQVLANRNRLIRRSQTLMLSSSDELRWLAWALECHADAEFHGVIATEELLAVSGMTNGVLIGLPSALESRQWLERRRSIPLTKCEADYRKHLSPILRHAQKVTLIDPFLSPHKERYTRSVELISELVGQRGAYRRPGKIVIHSGDPVSEPRDARGVTYAESVASRLTAWEAFLKPLATKWKHRLEVALWRNKPSSKVFHDRYLITDQCGISTPAGLDCLDAGKGNNTDWSMLEFETLADRLDDFNPSKSPYVHLLPGIKVLP